MESKHISRNPVSLSKDFEVSSFVSSSTVQYDEQSSGNRIQKYHSEMHEATDHNNEPTHLSTNSNIFNLRRFKSRSSRASCRAPVVMVSSLVLGLLLALTHHIMNQSLHHKPVDPTGGLSQQWTSRYAFGLAFLIKTCFVICVGTAFVQRQWLNVLTQKELITVKELDKLSNSLSDLFSLFSGRIWIRNPLLWLLVAISWTIPLAVIVTPATLIVEPRPSTNITEHLVPHVAFNKPNFMSILYDPIVSGLNITHSAVLLRTSYSTAGMSRILSTTPAFSNQSYTLSFFGPALRCKAANQSITARADEATRGRHAYASWAGDKVPWHKPFSYKPFDNGDSWLGINESDGNSLWVLSRLGTRQATSTANLTECRLWNASYDVEFRFQNFEQTTNIRDQKFYNPVWVTGSNWIQMWDAVHGSATIRNLTSTKQPKDEPILNMLYLVSCYKAIMSAFGSLLVGASDFGDLTTDRELWNINLKDAKETADGLQRLFQNITLSLFSVAQFQTDVLTNVTITSWPSTYVYKPHDLLLAYGIAFFFSLICCIVGLHSFLISGNSYENNFSTFISTAGGSNDRNVPFPGPRV